MTLRIGAYVEAMNNAWIGLLSIVSYDQKLDDCSEEVVKVSLSINEFIPWFESQMVNLCSSDLALIHVVVKVLKGRIKELKQASAAIRSVANSTSLPAPQLTKIRKFCDQLESPATMFALDEHSAPRKETLPDTEFLRDLITKLRSKLRIVDDLTSTLKLLKLEGGKKNPISFSKVTEITGLMLQNIDYLEDLMIKYIVLTDFILKMKINVMKPIQKFNQKVSKIAVFVTGPITATPEYKAMIDAEENYEKSRSNVTLVTVARLTEETVRIERMVGEMLKPLRQIVGLLGTKRSSPDHPTQPGAPVCRSLIPLLGCPDSEILARCATKSTMEEFASCLLELKLSIKNGPQKTSSKSGVPSKSSSVWSELSSSQALLEAAEFDTELFAAYTQDWQDRVRVIAKTAASSDFEKSYKRHCLARTNVQKAREKYDCSAAQHSEDEEKCNELSREFKELRKSIVYICRKELNIDVELAMS